MLKIKPTLYLLLNLKIVVKTLIALYKKPEQTIQELCDNIGTDDDLLMTKIIAKLRTTRAVKHDNIFVLQQLEDVPAILLGKFSLNKKFPRKATYETG